MNRLADINLLEMHFLSFTFDIILKSINAKSDLSTACVGLS